MQSIQTTGSIGDLFGAPVLLPIAPQAVPQSKRPNLKLPRTQDEISNHTYLLEMGTNEEKKHSMFLLRKSSSIPGNAPLKQMIDAGLVDTLVKFGTNVTDHKFTIDVLWTMTNIVSIHVG